MRKTLKWEGVRQVTRSLRALPRCVGMFLLTANNRISGGTPPLRMDLQDGRRPVRTEIRRHGDVRGTMNNVRIQIRYLEVLRSTEPAFAFAFAIVDCLGCLITYDGVWKSIAGAGF
jgi:hypothetical protein